MPRRPRPPLSAREIAAYLCGMRAAKKAGDPQLTWPELETLALEYAEQDMPIALSLDLDKYVHFFIMGYEMRLRLDAVR